MIGYRPDNWQEKKARFRYDASVRQYDSINQLSEAIADTILDALKAEGRYYRLHRVSRPRGYKQPLRAPGWVVFIPEKSREKERE